MDPSLLPSYHPSQAREKTEAEMEEELARAAATDGKLEYIDNKFAMFTARAGAAMAIDKRHLVITPMLPSYHPLRRGDGHR